MKQLLAVIVIVFIALAIVAPLVWVLRRMRRAIDGGWGAAAAGMGLSYHRRSRRISGELEGRSVQVELVQVVSAIVGGAEAQRGKGDHTRFSIGLSSRVEAGSLESLARGRAMRLEDQRLVWDTAGIMLDAGALRHSLTELLAIARDLEGR